MAEYRFRCTKCTNEKAIDAPMSDYDRIKDSQTCEKCGSRMNRVIEWKGSCALKSGDGIYGTDNVHGWND